MSPHLNIETRAKLANICAVIALLCLALSPWLLSESSVQMSRSLTLPRAFSERLPEGCHSLSLYVGYPGCNTECPRALARVALELSALPSTAERCAVFLNMFPLVESRPAPYAQRFHPELVDIALPANSLSSLLQQLGAEGTLAPNGAHKDLVYTLSKTIEGWRLTEVTPTGQWTLLTPE